MGPLPRSKEDYSYLLTTMCLESMYPDVFPLKYIRATIVVEGMMNIFSRIGLPRKLLTDQGKQFTGSLMNESCS